MMAMEDIQMKEHLIWNSVKITSWSQMREEILDMTRTQQYISTVHPCPCSSARNPKSRANAKMAEETELSKKARSDDQKKCFYCNKTCHVKAECSKRMKDFAEADGKLVAATPHPSDIATMTLSPQCLQPDERVVPFRKGQSTWDSWPDTPRVHRTS